MFPSFIRWTRNAKISYWLIIKKSSQKCENFYFLKYIIAVCINLSLSLELNVSISEFVLAISFTIERPNPWPTPFVVNPDLPTLFISVFLSYVFEIVNNS